MFDPSLPADATRATAAEMRAQFNGLNDRIDAQAAAIAAQAAQIADLQASLAAAIAGSSRNTNAVDLLSFSVSDPPNQSQVQTILDKVDQFISAARR